MKFRDDGGTPSWQANQATFRNHRKRPSFLQTLVLIVFFAYAVPWILVLGGPAVGALWDAVVGKAHAETTPMSVRDYIVDAADLKGKTISVQGLPGCVGAMCFLYAGIDAVMQNIVFETKDLDRDTRRMLLDCQPLVRRCEIVITGKAGSGPMGPASIAASSLRWITRP